MWAKVKDEVLCAEQCRRKPGRPTDRSRAHKQIAAGRIKGGVRPTSVTGVLRVHGWFRPNREPLWAFCGRSGSGWRRDDDAYSGYG